MAIFSFNYAKNTLGLKVDIVLWNPSQSLSLKKIVAEKLNTLMTMQTFLRPSVQYTEFSSLSRNGRGRYARKNNEQRLKLFVVAAFGICRHHRFVHETNVVHPYRILGASTSKSDTSLKNQGTGLCLRFHTPREV